MPEKMCRKKHLTSFQLIILGFAGVILLGSILLMLPVSSLEKVPTPFHEALFTATSAVCVTGLVVKDSGSYWSVFGQAVILALIQIGGFEKGLGKLGSLAGTGLKATTAAITAVSTALSACAVYCAKVGSEMETSMAKVSTIADTSAVSLGELQAGLQQISSSVGLSAASLSEAMYQALSASVATGDALQFVELSSKLAIGGFTDTETAVDALSSVVNAYGSELLYSVKMLL